MKNNNQTSATQSWSEIKDEVYGIVGTNRRDELERESETFKIGILLRQAIKKIANSRQPL